MRAATPLRLLIVPAALLTVGCDDTRLPQEPSIPHTEVAAPADAAHLSIPARWADGYLLAGSPTTPSYAPLPLLSYNRSGGAMNITKPAGTTGRYIVRFTGLSAVLGTKNTVHVTEYGLDDTYCKPVNGRLASDKLEVRCFRAGTRTPANTGFTVSVSGKRADRVFAYAHLPTSTNYSPAASASWNPSGPIKVVRLGLGVYRVTFDNFGTKVPDGVSGNAQVNAVGTGKAHCTLEDWGDGGMPNLNVFVRCYTPSGAPVDSKFTVLFLLPAPQVAYAFANQPSALSYSPLSTLSWNPAVGLGPITITRNGVGDYTVFWIGVDPAIVDVGTVQVTGAEQKKQCKATSLFDTGVGVHCFAANGAPADAYYSVMLGS